MMRIELNAHARKVDDYYGVPIGEAAH